MVLRPVLRPRPVLRTTSLTYSLGCIPLITHPTRITVNIASLIDHVYTNNVKGIDNSFILVSDMGDHFPIYFN